MDITKEEISEEEILKKIEEEFKYFKSKKFKNYVNTYDNDKNPQNKKFDVEKYWNEWVEKFMKNNFNYFFKDFKENNSYENYENKENIKKWILIIKNVFEYIKNNEKLFYFTKELKIEIIKKMDNILKKIEKYNEINHFEFEKIINEENKEYFKLNQKNKNEIIWNLTKENKNNDVIKRIKSFFEKEKIEEKKEVLILLANDIEGKVKKEIDYKFFNKERIQNLFWDLNNLYKHYDKSKNDQNKKRFEWFNNLNDIEKVEQMEEDIQLIIYLYIEHLRKKQLNK